MGARRDRLGIGTRCLCRFPFHGCNGNDIDDIRAVQIHTGVHTYPMYVDLTLKYIEAVATSDLYSYCSHYQYVQGSAAEIMATRGWMSNYLLVPQFHGGVYGYSYCP